MNRNYLPPTLKSLSQSPPSSSSTGGHFAGFGGGGSGGSLSGTTAPAQVGTASIVGNARRFYRPHSKLPTVQEGATVGRYSPVRRASEGSKSQFQGPLQECQSLQKGIAQRNFLLAPSTPLLENSISLPGSPIHSNKAVGLRRSEREVEVPLDAMKSLLPALERLLQDQHISYETANQIATLGIVPIELAPQLGLVAHTASSVSGGHLDVAALGHQIPAHQTTPKAGGAASGPLMFGKPHLATGIAIVDLCAGSSASDYAAQLYANFCCGSSPNPYMLPPSTSSATTSPLHQITKGISGLSTGGVGGSITRGTSAASEQAAACGFLPIQQPLDLSMETDSAWNPKSLSPVSSMRMSATPPLPSPSLCIIQEENGSGQICHTIRMTDSPHPQNEEAPSHPAHPQICLTDVQGSEFTLVAESSDNSRDSDDSFERNTSLAALQSLIIAEPSIPSHHRPSITLGTGRKFSLEQETPEPTKPASRASVSAEAHRRGSDKSLALSEDSLSNDSNNLSPCQEPSASSGFKSDTHSEMGDHTECGGHLTPDSACDSRRMSDDMCYELALSQECFNLDSRRILEILKHTIDSTVPPKGCVLIKGTEEPVASTSTAECWHAPVPQDNMTNLSLEYSGGLQIELQICEGRSRDNQVSSKNIKLRRISGDQYEYGKICQQLITTLAMQQVAG